MTPPPQPLTLAPDLLDKRHATALRDLTKGYVRFGVHDRMLYATDASLYQVEPLGVVIPASVDEIPRIVAYCAEHDLPILPRGGGTSLAGQCVNRAVVIDVSAHCTDIIAVLPDSATCLVEPGITIDDLNDRLAAEGHDLFFAPDPATARQCNVGGAIGNNAAGTRSIIYGRTAENLDAVHVVLSTGEEAYLGPGSAAADWADLDVGPPAIDRLRAQHATQQRLARGVIDICLRHEHLIRERFPKTLRRNAGYALDMILADIDRARAAGEDPLNHVNLAHLICGSEGTLAFTTRATLKLHPRPKARALGVLGFPSLDEAIDAVEHCLKLGPSAVELLDDLVIGLARENNEYRRYAELMPQPGVGGGGPLAAVLYVEFSSTSPAPDGAREVAGKLERLGALMHQVSPNAAYSPLSRADDIAQALKLRKAGEPLLHALPGARKPIGFVEDNAVPVEHLAEYVRDFRAILERNGTRGAFYAHASVGVLHVRPLLDPRDPADRLRMEKIAVEAADLAKRLGGVMSGEHGDGRTRGPLLERFFGPELMAAFREIKALFDPKGLMNPGNIIAPGPIASIHEEIRVRPHGHNLPHVEVETYFDYAGEGGFDHAVELCNGSGVCRKKQGGTMCPSYMATLDERHSTRGRGNALRLAITGQVGVATPAWNDPETLETLDLCLSCKACKTECPTNVDMARYKAEYLAHSYRAAGGPPPAAQIIARVRALNRLGSRFAPISNWVANLAPVRALTNRRLSIAPKRSLPPFRKSLFHHTKGHASTRFDALPPEAPSVLLFTDCFSTYNEPDIAIAAVRTLNAFGYRVHFPDVGCCARPAISLGLLDEARTTIESTLARLFEEAKRHNARAILFLEPSCLSAVTDDWRHLKLKASASDRAWLAERSFLAEDFLDKRWDEHPKRPSVTPPRGKLVLHAHCHQKALWGAETSARILERLFQRGTGFQTGVSPVQGGTGLQTGVSPVTILDSGCCGMAGAFGMAANRYDISMQIGELSLFPAARALGPDDTLIAPGASCRHQLHDGAQTTALHPIQVIDRALR